MKSSTIRCRNNRRRKRGTITNNSHARQTYAAATEAAVAAAQTAELREAELDAAATEAAQTVSFCMMHHPLGLALLFTRYSRRGATFITGQLLPYAGVVTRDRRPQ